MKIGVHGTAADLVGLEQKKIGDDKNRQGNDDCFDKIQKKGADSAKKAHKLIMNERKLAFKG